MRRFAAPLLLGVIGACALVIGRAVVDYRRDASSPAQSRRPLSLLEQQYRLEWNWSTEQEWIVSDIVAAIANMSAFARTGRAAIAEPA